MRSELSKHQQEIEKLFRSLTALAGPLTNLEREFCAHIAVPDLLDSDSPATAEQIDQRQALETFRRSHEILEAVIQSSPIGIITVDLEGKITSWNPAAEKMHGWKKNFR